MNKVLIGRIALVLTILFAVTALSQGGWWWACVAVTTAVTLWATAKPKDTE